ncbi:MAG: hypothetical protein GY898_28270 [Proteobacteria bacterium]|nr:hypothetical protein [Pseudomonadota bacterium]
MPRSTPLDLCLFLAAAGCQEVTLVDNECAADEAELWYLDADGDGFGISDDFLVACDQPDGYVLEDGDCDDDDAARHPDAREDCDGIDNDCNGLLDSEDGSEEDLDEDGARGCVDCDDLDDANFPGNVEICDGQDNDCNGLPDFDGGGELDGDGDGVRACMDCDDTDPNNVNGGIELCDGLDNDCNGLADYDVAGEVDADADGWLSCEDCDDSEAVMFPGNPEVCDGLDNDCDGAVPADEGDADGNGVLDCAEVTCSGNGMTWELIAHDAALNADRVGCGGICQPYAGDTACSEFIPIVCVESTGAPDPGLAVDYYEGWFAGNVDVTSPVQGCALTDLATADAICAAQLGAGWRMAEFHDGSGGWSFWAYGNINQPPPAHFWTYINDQPGNCWN